MSTYDPPGDNPLGDDEGDSLPESHMTADDETPTQDDINPPVGDDQEITIHYTF